MSVFISHSSKDKPAVEALALGLRERGIEVWLDKWQIGPGDDIVASINAGLDEAGCGIIVFSAACREHRWVEAEVSYLTYARFMVDNARSLCSAFGYLGPSQFEDTTPGGGSNPQPDPVHPKGRTPVGWVSLATPPDMRKPPGVVLAKKSRSTG